MQCQEFAIAPDVSLLAHRDAYRLSKHVLRMGRARTIIIDFSTVEDVTTSAFARLVLLRRELRRRGRDLRLTGLRARAARQYELNRLDAVLPMLSMSAA